MSKLRIVKVGIGVAVVLGVLRLIVPAVAHVDSVSGVVRDAEGQPVQGAVVRIKTTAVEARTDAEGRFRLTGFEPAFEVRVTAWREGDYVTGQDAYPWDADLDLVLEPFTGEDHADYQWVPPEVERGSVSEEAHRLALAVGAAVSFDGAMKPISNQLTLGCRDCHGGTIVDQWAGSAHAQGASNLRFLTLYNGTDMDGNQSPVTRRASDRDYGSFPLPPDSSKPYYGPGYRLDFPDDPGSCATCHLPSAALKDPYGVDPNLVSGVDAKGTHCDLCHKTADVELDPSSGRPFENMPGILSMKLRRPGPDRQLFFGPYDDVDVGPDTFNPAQKESRICASCHTASFWGVPIYESFAEWQASDYAQQGVTCQDCHMKPDGVATNFAPGRGGLERDPQSVPTHHFPGAADDELLAGAAKLNVQAKREGDRVLVTVEVHNTGAGHHLPTGSPLRHLILLVKANADAPLALVEGPNVPTWGGEGDPARGYYGGQPGTIYAKVLEDVWLGESPTAAYWNPTRIVSDNRIPASGSDTTRYAFAAPSGTGAVQVEARLLLRRGFKKLMDQKKWRDPDRTLVLASVSAPPALRSSEATAGGE